MFAQILLFMYCFVCRLVRYRWVVPAGGGIKLKLLFQSRDVGQFDQTLNFEIVGTRRRLQLFCRGLCVVPSICREPRYTILYLSNFIFWLHECPKILVNPPCDIWIFPSLHLPCKIIISYYVHVHVCVEVDHFVIHFELFLGLSLLIARGLFERMRLSPNGLYSVRMLTSLGRFTVARPGSATRRDAIPKTWRQ